MKDTLPQYATLTDVAPSDIEENGLRDRLNVADSQIAQLEYAVAQLAKKLKPVLRPVISDPSGEACEASTQPQPVRSQAAEAVHQQGARIYQAHRDLQAIEQRLAL